MADEIITRQELVDAKVDAKDLGECVHGNESGIVTPRLGDPYPTLPAAIHKIENVGGYITAPTLSSLQAIVPTFNHQVGRDDSTGNEYRWNPAASPTPQWEPTGRNYIQDAKNYTDQKSGMVASELINEYLTRDTSNPLAIFDDADGRVYAFFDAFAELFLAGSDVSVQEIGRIAGSFANLLNTNISGNIWEIRDSEGNLGVFVDSNNELFLTGLNVSVQEAIRNINTKAEYLSSPTSQFSAADLPVVEVMSSFNYLKNSGMQVCDLPKNLYPQQFNVGKAFLNTVSAPIKNPSDYIQIDVWNDRGDNTSWKVDSGVVHPNVIDFGVGKMLNGYRYWMGLNPYTNTNENYELPYIFGSNDLNDWDLMTNIPCPFDVDPKTNADDPAVESTSGHLSDSFFTYDTSSGELFFCWRRNLYFENGRDRAKAKGSLWARSTKDGLNWTDKFEIYPEYTNITGHLLLAPAIVFNPEDNLFYLYHVSDTINGYVRVQTSPSLHNPKWSEMVAVEGLESIVPYHIEAKYVGDRVFLLIHSEVTDQLYFAVSDDFLKFKVSKKILETDTDTYKGSFLPIFNDQSQIAFHVFYTSDQKAQLPWRLYHTQTNFNSLGVE
ncbi:hypothetical protein A1Z38_RS14745 [Acinetobacter baumannii]|nr:hypothetical protein [Acinetobacter baumannii]